MSLEVFEGKSINIILEFCDDFVLELLEDKVDKIFVEDSFDEADHPFEDST